MFVVNKNKIAIYRKHLNMTLSEMASKVGISPGYLCHLENGSRNNPSIRVMEKIACVLHSSISDIFFSE